MQSATTRRGLLYGGDVLPLFSGHETFPLRHGWLEKVAVAVTDAHSNRKQLKKIFELEQAIPRFGVGKNMVASMRHWALATGIVQENGVLSLTQLGEYLLGEKRHDPYLEDPGSIWLLHWNLATSTSRAASWTWIFNYYSSVIFDRNQLVECITKYIAESESKRVAIGTLRRDIECFVRCYVPKEVEPQKISEDNLESPLSELALILPLGHGTFQLQKGDKPTLPDELFACALLKYWRTLKHATKTLSAEAIAHEPGAPGRIFQLDENALVERLERLETVTRGEIVWSETAGLRQVFFHLSPDELNGYQDLRYLSGMKKPARKKRSRKKKAA